MWVKICGIRDVSTANQVAALKPEAIGLNFYAKSPRCVPRATAKQIAANLPQTVQAVGLFVNSSVAEVVDAAAECGLTMIQLHGDESPDFLVALQQQLPGTPLLRAWRMGNELHDLSEYLGECRRLNVTLAGCLIDAKVAGSYGGTGQTPPWNVLRTAYRRDDWPPLILAGGLSAENVAAGIEAVQPWGVDVASGEESSPGVKDLARVERFIAAARQERIPD
jgi:phosphoribosylanthranilate isomerase